MKDESQKLNRSTLIKVRYEIGLALLDYQRAFPTWNIPDSNRNALYIKMERQVKNAFGILLNQCKINEDDCSPESLRSIK